MYKSRHIKTKTLKKSSQIYLGFYLKDLYSNKNLNKLIGEKECFNYQGLTYFGKTDLPNSILENVVYKK